MAARPRRLTSLIAFTCVCVSLLAAQEPHLGPGQRLRVTLDDGGRVGGTLVWLDADTMLLSQPEFAYKVPFASVTRLEVHRRRPGGRGAVTGAGIGLVSGAGAGALVHLAFDDVEPVVIPVTAGAGLLWGTVWGATGRRGVVGGLLGLGALAAVGAVVGSAADVEGDDVPPWQWAGIGAGVGGFAGLIAGTIVGAATGNWREVPPERVRVGVGPGPGGGVVVGAAFRF